MIPIDMAKILKQIEAEGAEKIYEMLRIFLNGTRGDAPNTLMAAAECNLWHWKNKHAASLFLSWLLALVRRIEKTIIEIENQLPVRPHVSILSLDESGEHA